MIIDDREESAEIQMVRAVHSVAHAINNLRNADAGAPMGGLEAHTAALKEGLDGVAYGLLDIGNALQEVAAAIREH